MASRSLFVGVLGLGVFLAGLELMITAVALPSIIADPQMTDWTQLRRASWIINGYLLAYVTAMPLAGRASDRFGTRRLFLVALALFAIGSVLAGRAQSLDELVAARVVQGFGGGALVPLATASASHLFGERGRPRALGVVGALTFLGMAAGPVVGAIVLQVAHVEPALRGSEAGLVSQLFTDLAVPLAPAWRWVFYFNIPIALLALLWTWAIDIDTPRGHARIDVVGGALFASGLAAGLAAITWSGAAGSRLDGTVDLAVSQLFALVAFAVLALGLTVARGAFVREPFLELHQFRDSVYASAVALSLLTGYGFATAIIGGAVFVDRVLYGGPETQQVALGALAGATALGALGSGFLVRLLSYRLSALLGLAISAFALWRMSGWDPDVSLGRLALDLGVFGLGFGATVTPRSTAAVESVGRAKYGAASAAVTVARMVGMAIGLAVLTQIGSNRIDALARIVDDPRLRDTILPPDLRGLPLQNALVVAALERWAAGEAAQIMSVLFLVALGVTVLAAGPAWALGRGRRREAGEIFAG